MMRSRAPFLRGAVALLGFVLVAGCMDATLLQTQSAEASISIQQAPAGVAEIQLTITGPGMSPISRTLTPSTESVILEIPIGPDRVFEANAGGYSARVVRAVTAGGVNVELSLSVAAEGTLLFARGSYDSQTGDVVAADVYTIDAAGLNEQQLTNFGGSISGAGWTPDGNWVLFLSGEDFYRVRADGGEQFGPLTGGLGTPKFIGGIQPNGTRIAYSYTAAAANVPSVYTVDIGAVNPSEAEIATNAGFTFSQTTIGVDLVARDVVDAWSPDGTQILLATDENGGQGLIGRLYVADTDGVNPVSNAVAISTPEEAAVSGQWLPDGSGVVYAQTDGQSTTDMDIYLYDVGSQASTRLINTTALDRNLRVSPDGTSVLFDRYDPQAFSSEYRVVDVASGTESVLTDPAEFFGFYGEWIGGTNEISLLGIDAATSAVQIHIYSSSGTLLDTVENSQLAQSFPSQWSANGAAASVMLDETGSGGYDLYLLSRATGDLSPITDTPEAEIGGYWRP